MYKGKVSNNANAITKNYIGMTQPAFKTRFHNHVRDASNATYRNTTELSKYIWSLKDEDKITKVDFEIMYTVPGNPTSTYCILCSTEKLVIIENLHDNTFLNKRSEFISKCRHLNRYKIGSVKDSNDWTCMDLGCIFIPSISGFTFGILYWVRMYCHVFFCIFRYVYILLKIGVAAMKLQ